MGERLRLAREHAGYDTAARAARAIGLNDYTYRHYESGRREVPTDVLVQAARMFRVSLDWLLTGQGGLGGESTTAAFRMAADGTLAALPNGRPTTENEVRVEVGGGSSAYRAGTILVFGPAHAASKNIGKLSLVEQDGGAFVATIWPDTGPGRYILQRPDGVLWRDQPVEKARPFRASVGN